MQCSTTYLNIVIGELAQLVIVHTQEFGLLRSTEVETRDVVDNIRKNGTHDKGIASACKNVGELNVELSIIANRPSTNAGTCLGIGGASVDTVKSNDIVNAEESIEN